MRWIVAELTPWERAMLRTLQWVAKTFMIHNTRQWFVISGEWLATYCQSRMKIPHFAGRKFPTPEAYKAASLASDAVEPSAVLWRVLGVTESEAKELDAARSCSRAGTSPALRRSFNR